MQIAIYTITEFIAIDLNYPELTGMQSAITHSPPVVDHSSKIHVPLALFGEGRCTALDFLYKDAIVEAIRVPAPSNASKSMPLVALERFPSKGGSNLSFGNGVTDGVGIIMVMASAGSLYTSNSQAGGINYPPPSHLNHEMPYIAAYDSSECYTSGDKPNVVTMDYIFLEADPLTQKPASRDIHLETWDMPLRTPILKAVEIEGTVEVTIEQNAFFYPGETTFTFDGPKIVIKSVSFLDSRNARIETCVSAKGAVISFEVKTLFYHHAGRSQVI
jgi:hypothetical protein